MKISKIITFGILLIAAILSVKTCRNAGTWLVKDVEPIHADAIILLMGSMADRVLEATDKFKQGKAEQIIIVEESMGAYKALELRGAYIISNTQQVRNALITLGVPAENIIVLPGNAASTQMEAKIIRDYLVDKPDTDTLFLITSPTHTRRASMIFESAFRDTKIPVHVYSSPSAYTDFNAKKWWKSKDDIQLVLMEYVKMADFLIFE